MTFNNIPAALMFVSQGQINAQVPWKVLPNLNGAVVVTVTVNGTPLPPFNVTLTPFSPAIFATQAGAGPGIAINPDDWQSLVKAVNTRANGYGGTVGFVIKDFKSGQVASGNADLAFPSASLIKFPILCAAFQAVEEGRLSLSMPVTQCQ